MNRTLEIYRDLMKSSAPASGKGPRILEVVQLWHDEVLDLGHYLQGASPPIASDDLPTFTWDGADPTCTVHETWSGTLDIGDERIAIADAIARGLTSDRGGGYHAFALSDDRLATVDHGSMSFAARMVEPEQRLRSRIRIDAPFAGVMSSVATLGAIVAALVLTSPLPPESEIMEAPDRIATISLVPPPPPVQAVAKTETPADQPKRASAVAKADPRRKRFLDRQTAESSGILPALAELDKALGAGLDAALHGAGNLIGTGGASVGGGGPWFAGRGPIGGGGSIDGIGDVGTKGGPGYGSEGGDLGIKRVGEIHAASDPTVVGALGKAEIDTVIKRNLPSIRYCYERQLSRSPDLAGKVSIKFVISKSGGVSRAVVDSSTVHDSALESCLQSRFLRMQFPEPKGGGIVLVTYPFLFAPG